uniref:Uncharacterized protein n=2 Tax=viral metagenome TaxID=1070528 RepID=A0A6M3Y0R7_9ZZZZ
MAIHTAKGQCKHGEFDLLRGCPQCVSERLAQQLKEKLKTNIVKVKYISDSGELSNREYTYLTVDRLNVDDIVTVPVRDTTAKAVVSVVDVAETEIEAFKDKVKTIPTGSKVKVEPHTTEELSQTEIEAIAKDIEERRARGIRPEQDEMEDGLNSEGLTLVIDEAPKAGFDNQIALVKVKPSEDVQVQSWYNEALGLQKYAEARIIKTVEDLKPANDDLVTIRRLRKAIEEKRKEYVKPLQDHVKSINDAFKILSEPIEIADKVTSQKMLAFTSEQDRIRSEQERINAERIKLAQDEMELNGELTESVNLVEVIQEVPTTIKTEVGTTGQRDNWKWEVQDINQVPREYLMINVGMLTPIVKASKGKIVIPGIRIFNEPILATRQ